MTDLRKTFTYIQRRYGHDVLLQRKKLETTKVGPHRYEDNRGFNAQLEKFTVRSMPPSRNTAQLVQARQEMEEGVGTMVDRVFYFQWNAHPKEGDRIYMKDDRYLGVDKTEFPGYELYIIDYAVPNFGIGGRVEYYTVGATRAKPN